MSRSLTVMVSAGEASGDSHAANAIRALHADGFDVSSFGMGANHLKGTGTDLIVDCRDLAVIGIADVLINYPRFMRRLNRLREEMQQRKPDILLLVDYPDFNLKLAETAKKMQIPVLFYISPKVWAWRAGRVKRIASLVSHMAVIFPFEVDIYQRENVPVTYVGNPVVADAQSPLSRDEACLQVGLETEHQVVGLLPGSRRSEISRNLPVMVKTARLIRQQSPSIQFLLPVAPTLDIDLIQQALDDVLPQWLSLSTVDSRTAMRAADVALVASGTATLETALIGTPMVVMYVINPLNYAIMKRLIQIPDISLVNIVAERRIVPEYLQHAANPETLSNELRSLLSDHERRTVMLEDLKTVKLRMGDANASKRVARLLAQLVKTNA
ncbi:MAG: lipid-A-disaccharide synthase [Granulosicoccus sp.]